jgi:hypothetical protein
MVEMAETFSKLDNFRSELGLGWLSFGESECFFVFAVFSGCSWRVFTDAVLRLFA